MNGGRRTFLRDLGRIGGMGLGCACGLFLAAGLACPASAAQAPLARATPVRIRAVYDHDPEAYTQGLVYAGGALFESTGLYGHSTVRRVALETGKVLQSRALPDTCFGEGLALHDGVLTQLTWREETAFLYDASTLAPRGARWYRGEGWGLVRDERQYWMTDGSARVTLRDARFEAVGGGEVRHGDQPLPLLNELELVRGRLFANVYTTWLVGIIEPGSWRVVGLLDLAPLQEDLARREAYHEVANGLAWDEGGSRLLVTGKRWPYLYAVTWG